MEPIDDNTNERDSDNSSKPAGRRNIDLSEFGDKYWDSLPKGTKNGVFQAVVDLGIPLHKAGIQSHKSVENAVNSGIFNLFEMLENPHASENQIKAIRWAIAKTVLGDEIEMIKSGTVIANQYQNPEKGEVEAKIGNESSNQPKVTPQKIMPRNPVPAFLVG